MKTKYEIVTVNNVEITVDVSLLFKTDELFFNATQMAKPFEKRVNDFLNTSETGNYIKALITLNGGNKDDFTFSRRGKYGGTWLHRDLALQFARWLSPLFAVHLDRWTRERILQEHEWKQKRMEARTGYLPMTNAIQRAHEDPQHYHFSNEANLINRVVLGMDSKAYCELNEVPTVRDGVSAFELFEINRLQTINTGLIEMGMDYDQRKAALIECHQKELNLIGWGEAA